MKRMQRVQRMKGMAMMLVVLAGASAVSAQDDVLIRRREPAIKEGVERTVIQREQQVVGEMRAKMAVEARVTPGAPYSAEAVTETTQLLADGNRINRKSLTRVFRDGEGRTRREEVDEAGTVVSVSIVDPVAHASYVLQPKSRTAYRQDGLIALPRMLRDKIETDKAMRTRTSAPPPPPPPPPAPETGVAIRRIAPGSIATEDLGQQTIEGLTAAGTRTTSTIAAGEIGNLQPIKVISEQWFSPELQLLVMTKHSDPRTGETTYRLQGIVRAEPDGSLFTVPADYTLKGSGIRQPQ